MVHEAQEDDAAREGVLMESIWENVEVGSDSITYRMEVPGGWIVRHTDCHDWVSSSMVFLPDPQHEWVID